MTDYRFDAQKARTAALACWGTPANTISQPEPPADGEVAELVVCLHRLARADWLSDETADILTRAADLLECLAEPEPVPKGPTNQYIEALHHAVFASRLHGPPPNTSFEVDFARAVLARWRQP